MNLKILWIWKIFYIFFGLWAITVVVITFSAIGIKELLAYFNISIFTTPVNIETIGRISIIVSAIGTVIYAGLIKGLSDNYRLIRVGFNREQLIMFYGASIFSVIALALYLLYNSPPWKITVLIGLLILIFTFGFLLIGYVLGKYIIIKPIKTDTVTLNSPITNASGIMTPELSNLELYQITDTDYRFKEAIIQDKKECIKEYIIPKEQVKNIEIKY